MKVLTYGQKGEVLELIDENEAVVQMGIIKMKLPIEDLENEKQKSNLQNGSTTKSSRCENGT